MDPQQLDLRTRYLDLIEKRLRNEIYGEDPLTTRINAVWQRLRHPYLTRRGPLRWPARAHTMLGRAGLRNLRELIECTLSENIPGDYIETGVWRGGACILMCATLAAHGVRSRRVFVADSFAGLPKPDARLPRTSAIACTPSTNWPSRRIRSGPILLRTGSLIARSCL